MENCVFCKIISGEYDSARIWEDGEFLAILDVQPNIKGMTLVMPKQHFDSYAFEMPDDVFERFLKAGKKVARLLDEKLKVQRTALVMEGLGVNHAHLKLYPLHGLDEEFKVIESTENVFFEKYEGYLTTQMGPKTDLSELKKLAEKIRSL
ncbi:MAG TPA: HIT family protein [Candidatus Norongarragalinales archaeon]|nr:HIT family protein [Candidatus Norongarragalinales archaeon]